MNQQDAYAKAKEALIAAVEDARDDETIAEYNAAQWALIVIALRIASGTPIVIAR